MLKKFLVLLFMLFPIYAFAADSNLDKITDFTISKINETISAIKTVAPQITEMAVKVTQIEAERWIIIGFIWLSISLLLLSIGALFMFIGVCIHNKELKKERYNQESDAGLPQFIVGCFSTVFGLICLLIAVFNLGDYWNWVGVYHPDILLAHNLLEYVMK